MSQVAAPADRRFRRAHVKPARHRRTLRSFGVPAGVALVIAIGVVFVGVRGRTLLARSALLQVDRIVVHGNERLSKGEVLAILDGLRGESLFGTDLEVWRQRLMASPWVLDAALRRSLPSTVDVVISERTPAGIGRVRNEMYLFDERGIVIDQYGPQYADLDLPIIDGLAAASSERTAADDARAELASRIIAAVRSKPDLARRVSQLDVADLHNASVILSGDPAVIYIGDDNFVQRLQMYIDVAPALRERVASIDYVDLRFDDRIYVRPSGAARATEISSRAPQALLKKARPQTKRP
jgi:cell division septal protein FtsQ